MTSFEGDCARTVVGESYSTDEAIAALGRLAVHLSAIIGAQFDHMTRDDGWRLMTIGRYIERLGTLARVLQLAFDTGALGRDDGHDFVLQLFDSTITYRALYQRRLEVLPLIDLLVQESANPRSLHGIARRLSNQIDRLGAPGADGLKAYLPSIAQWPELKELGETDADGRYPRLAGTDGAARERQPRVVRCHQRTVLQPCLRGIPGGERVSGDRSARRDAHDGRALFRAGGSRLPLRAPDAA